MVDFMLIKIVALGWILFALFFAVVGGRKASPDEKSTGYWITASLCLLPAAITYAERSAVGGDGVFLWFHSILGPLGFLLVGVGVALHVAGMATLRRQWTSSVALSDRPALITHGLYRWIRNPIYTGILTVLLGLGLTLGNWIALLLLVVPNAATFGYRVAVEEKFLHKNFGAEYDDYRRRTKRFVPLVF